MTGNKRFKLADFVNGEDMLRVIDILQVENEELKKENEDLKQENRALKTKLHKVQLISKGY